MILLLLSVFTILHSSLEIFADMTSDKIEDVFLFMHDFDCKDNRNVVTALQQSKALSEKEMARLESIVDNSTHISNHGRRLSEISWQDRRHQLINVLDFYVSEHNVVLQTASASSFSNTPLASLRFLENVGIDVVNNKQLPNNELLKFARRLPCQKYPAEPRKYLDPVRWTPNDFRKAYHWYLEPNPIGVGVLKAWECHHGQYDGPTVAVIDTGCSANGDFFERLCKNGDSCVGSDYSSKTTSPFFEEHPHGTQVVSVIVASANNGYGVVGTYPGCKIMCIKASNVGGRLPSDLLVEAANLIIKHKDTIRISNHSYGGWDDVYGLKAVFELLAAANIIAVVASGNDGCDIDPNGKPCIDPETKLKRGPRFPASYNLPNMVVVGASTRSHGVAHFSNYGKATVHLMAPGENIVVNCNTLLERCVSKLVDGTSFSAPIVSAAFALMIALDSSLTAVKAIELLLSSVQKLKGLKGSCTTGGVLDIDAALKAVVALKPTSPCISRSPRVFSPPTVDHTADYYPAGFAEDYRRRHGKNNSFSFDGFFVCLIVFIVNLTSISK